MMKNENIIVYKNQPHYKIIKKAQGYFVTP